MKARLFLLLALSTILSSAKADSLIVSRNDVPIIVTLQKCETDGNSVIREIGRGKKVVIPTSVINEFRGNLDRGVLPAVCLVIELATPVKNNHLEGVTDDGATGIQIENGHTIVYFFDPETHRTTIIPSGSYP